MKKKVQKKVSKKDLIKDLEKEFLKISKQKPNKKTVKKSVTKAKKPSEKQIKSSIEKDFLNLFIEENEIEYIDKVDRFNEFKKLDKRRKYEFEGKKYKYKTLYNKLLNDAIKSNTIKAEAEKRIGIKEERAESLNPKRGEFMITMMVWDEKSITDSVLNNTNIDFLNGIDLEKDQDQAIELIDGVRLSSKSTDVIVIYMNYKTRKARIKVIDAEKLKDIENK